MRCLSITLFFLFQFFTGLQTNAQPAKTVNKNSAAATKTNAALLSVQAMFERFFALSDGDTVQLIEKSRLGLNICKTDPASKYCTYVSAWGNIVSKKFQVGLNGIEKLERDYPDWAEVYFLHAQYFVHKEETGYIEQAQKCIELNPLLVQPCFFLASHYEELQNYKLSLVYYNQLEKIDSKHQSLYYNRASVKGKSGDYEGAILDYAKALQINPAHSRALFNRGHAHMNLKDYVNATTDFDAFLKIMPKYALAYYYRGAAQYYQDNKTAACEDMKTASDLGHSGATSFINSYCK